MIPVRLELKNFLAYRSPDPLRFEGIHLACLTGANGAGKSSLLDAITWALWGRARAKRDDDMIYLSQNDMHVQLDFEQEGTIYRVIRKRSRRQRGTGSLDLFAEVDDEWVTQSEPAIRDTQNKINRLLRLDYETFVHSAFLQQGKADAFTTKAPAQRKQILSDILGLAAWEGYEEATKDILKSITAELGVIDMRVTEIERELLKEPGLQAVLVEAQQAQQEAQDSLTAAEKQLEEVAHAPAEMRNAQERLADCERRKREHERDLEAIASDIERQTTRAADYQSIIEARADIEAGYAALQSARQADTDLADKLMQLSDFDAQHHELENQLRDARAELENEASAYEARIAELSRALELADPDELSVVQSDVFTLQERENERNRLDELTRQMGEERANLSGLQEGLETEGKTIRKRLAELQATQDPICPLCGQPLDEAHREQIIAQLETEIEERRENYRDNQERVKSIAGELKDHRDQMADLDLELKRLHPLIERASVLQAQIDSAATAETRMSEEQARLDAVITMLEGETFAQDIRQQLAALNEQRVGIGYDRGSHELGAAAVGHLPRVRNPAETTRNRPECPAGCGSGAGWGEAARGTHSEGAGRRSGEDRRPPERNRATGSTGGRAANPVGGSQPPTAVRANAVQPTGECRAGIGRAGQTAYPQGRTGRTAGTEARRRSPV